MASWLDRLTGGGKAKSANSAKERLKLVLIHDRTDISPKDMEDMKNELLKVISRYVDIDPQAVQINMQQEGREQRLVADIPLKVATRRRVG
jgi:cell division topological specificity factor